MRAIALFFSLSAFTATNAVANEPQCADIFNQSLPKLHSSKEVNLCEVTANKVVLVVNTASKCGFTPQFEQLQNLYNRFGEQGFTIVGFPSNDFRQELKDEGKIADICYQNYGVSFTMTQPVHVRGGNAIDIFENLAEQADEYPRWNFHKYLVDKNGTLLGSFDTQMSPEADEIVQLIQANLAAN